MSKYVTTVIQVLSLKEEELDLLARHLGHDIRVHRDFYRLHDETLELSKVSKLLVAVEQGKIHENKGKSLGYINIDSSKKIPI